MNTEALRNGPRLYGDRLLRLAAAVRDHPGSTARQLARATGSAGYVDAVKRRLSRWEASGWVRVERLADGHRYFAAPEQLDLTAPAAARQAGASTNGLRTCACGCGENFVPRRAGHRYLDDRHCDRVSSRTKRRRRRDALRTTRDTRPDRTTAPSVEAASPEPRSALREFVAKLVREELLRLLTAR